MRNPRRLAVPALLLILPIIFFHRVCLGGEIFLLRDLFNWFYPWRAFAADSLARGDLPLWNPFSYMGTPFLANMQSGLLYPPNVFFWILDFPAALRLYVIAQFALAAWFMYLPLRAIGCRASSALTGSIGYAYGGWMVANVEFPNKLGAAAWLPLIVHGVILWRRGRRPAGLAVGSAATACCITTGYPSTALIVLTGAGVVWSAWVIGAAIARGRPGLLRESVSLPAIVALGLLIASAQILPFLEAASISAYRAPFDPEHLVEKGLHPVHFLQLALPRLFGLPGYGRFWGGPIAEFWLISFHVGVVTLALAPLALAGLRRGPEPAGGAARRDATVAGLVLLVLAGAFCLGDRTPLASLLVTHIPGFGHLKWISTASLLVAFALCWLGALGQERLLESLETGGGRLPAPAILLPAALWVAAAGLAVLVTVWPGAFHGIVEAAVSPVMLPGQRSLLAGNLEPVRSDAIRAGAIAALLAGAWWAAAGRKRAVLVGASLPLLLFFDLKGAAAEINFTARPDPYHRVPPLAAELGSRPDPLFRLYVPRATLQMDRVMYGSERPAHFNWAADTLLYNLNLPHRLFSASDGDPLRHERWVTYDAVMDGNMDDARGRLLALGNVGVIVRSDGAGGTQTIEVPVRMPRVHVAAGARRAPGDDVLKAILRPDFDPYVRVIVEEDFPGEPRPGPGRPVEHQIHRVDYANNSVTIDVECAEGGYLVLADASYPGWRATVDSRAAPIFTANFLFRGLDLPPGRHTVRFRYRPWSLAWGAAGSGLGLLLLAATIRRSGPSHRGGGGGTDPGPPRREPSP